MFKKNEFDLDLEKRIDKERKSIEKTFKKNYETQLKTLEMFQKSIEHSDYNNFKDSKVIWNLGSYINLVSLDLKTIGENLFLTKNEWSKRFFARQSALLIYEAINDIFELTGKDLRKIISKFSNHELLNNELKSLSKELNDYKEVYFEQLKSIRHNCVAHRDKNSTEQLKIILSLGWSLSIDFTTKFDKILNAYGKFSQGLINTSLTESKELK